MKTVITEAVGDVVKVGLMMMPASARKLEVTEWGLKNIPLIYT
jgi:hypothetical protein